MRWTFVLLGLAVLSVWLPKMPLGRGRSVAPWIPLFIAAVARGVVAGILDWQAVLTLTVFAASVWGSLRVPMAAIRAALVVLTVFITLALPANVFPGFHNPVLPEVDGVRVYLNFGMATAGLFLLVAYARRITSLAEFRAAFGPAAAAMTATVLVVFTVAWAGGYVRPDLKWLPISSVALAANLVFVCVTEEALCRGLLQERLAVALQRWPTWRWLPIAASSVLFGLAHAGKGPIMVSLATLAGVGYALAYSLTRRIEAAVLTHFAVNAVNHVGFAYTW